MRVETVSEVFRLLVDLRYVRAVLSLSQFLERFFFFFFSHLRLKLHGGLTFYFTPKGKRKKSYFPLFSFILNTRQDSKKKRKNSSPFPTDYLHSPSTMIRGKVMQSWQTAWHQKKLEGIFLLLLLLFSRGNYPSRGFVFQQKSRSLARSLDGDGNFKRHKHTQGRERKLKGRPFPTLHHKNMEPPPPHIWWKNTIYKMAFLLLLLLRLSSTCAHTNVGTKRMNVI